MYDLMLLRHTHAPWIYRSTAVILKQTHTVIFQLLVPACAHGGYFSLV